MSSGDRVWVIEDGVVGTVLQYGANVSLVTWTSDGIVYEEYLDNTDFLEYERIDIEED